MKISNPLNYDLKKFLIAIITINVATLGLIGLQIMGFELPILRQIFCFIYLTFLPGIIILRILNIRNLDFSEVILYSVGLSISSLMFVGGIINFISPSIGINNPLSIYISIPISILMFLSLFIIAFIEKNRKPIVDMNNQTNSFSLSKPLILSICLLLLFSVLVAKQISTNIIINIVLFFIATIPFLAYFNIIKPDRYEIVIFLVSIALLIHTTFSSMYIWGQDINNEYFVANLALKNSIWDPSIKINVNSLLSLVILGPIYSRIMNLDLTWAFKIAYMIVYSLVPVGLFRLYPSGVDKLISFLSCFFFVAFEFFYFDTPTGMRMQIVELFMVLSLLLIIDRKLEVVKKKILLVIFLLSIIVSHYGTSYLYMLIFVIVYILLKINPLKLDVVNKKQYINSNWLALFIISSITWFINASSSSSFIDVVDIFKQMSSSLFTDLLDRKSSQGLDIALGAGDYGIMPTLERYVQFFCIFLILIGLVFLIYPKTRKKYNFNAFYLYLIIINVSMDIAGVIIPHFSEQLSAYRVYHLTLIVIAPLLIIGLIELNSFIFARLNRKDNQNHSSNMPIYIPLILMMFLLINSCWLYQITGDTPHSIRSIALMRDKVDMGKDIISKNAFYLGYYLDQDVQSIEWFSKIRSYSPEIYCDYGRSLLLKSYGGIWPTNLTNSENFTTYIMNYNDTIINDGSYIILGYPNVKFNLVCRFPDTDYWILSEISSTLAKSNLIYDNADAEILITRPREFEVI